MQLEQRQNRHHSTSQGVYASHQIVVSCCCQDLGGCCLQPVCAVGVALRGRSLERQYCSRGSTRYNLLHVRPIALGAASYRHIYEGPVTVCPADAALSQCFCAVCRCAGDFIECGGMFVMKVPKHFRLPLCQRPSSLLGDKLAAMYALRQQPQVSSRQWCSL